MGYSRSSFINLKEGPHESFEIRNHCIVLLLQIINCGDGSSSRPLSRRPLLHPRRIHPGDIVQGKHGASSKNN